MHDIDLGWVWHDMSPVVEKAQGVVREHAVAFRPENLCPVLHGFTDKTTVAHADRVAEQQYAALVGRVWIDNIAVVGDHPGRARRKRKRRARKKKCSHCHRANSLLNSCVVVYNNRREDFNPLPL